MPKISLSLQSVVAFVLIVGLLLAGIAGFFVLTSYFSEAKRFRSIAKKTQTHLEQVWASLRSHPIKSVDSKALSKPILLRFDGENELLSPVHLAMPIPALGLRIQKLSRSSAVLIGEGLRAQKLWERSTLLLRRGEIAQAKHALRQIPAETTDVAGLPFDLLVPYRLLMLQEPTLGLLLKRLKSSRYSLAFRQFLFQKLQTQVQVPIVVHNLSLDSTHDLEWSSLHPPPLGGWDIQAVKGHSGVAFYGSHGDILWASKELLRSLTSVTGRAFSFSEHLSIHFSLASSLEACSGLQLLSPNVSESRGCLQKTIATLQSGPLRLSIRQLGWLQNGGFIWGLLGLFLVVLLLVLGGFILQRLLHQESMLHQKQRLFAAVVVHELRSPLTSLVLTTEMLSEQAVPVERLGRYHQRLHEQVQRLKGVVENVISFYRGKEGTGQQQRVSLHKAAKEAIASLAPIAARAGNVLLLELSEGSNPCTEIEITAEPSALMRAFVNVLDNAIRYAPGSAVIVQIGPTARVIIQDQGPGIPEDLVDSLFLPFVQGKRLEGGGLGLGLSLVQEVISRSGGAISAHNQPEGGAVFVFEWGQYFLREEGREDG